VSAVHFVVPGSIDDPARPSGGNTYDRRVSNGLTALGWAVREHLVTGSGLGAAVEGVPDGEVVLVDGLLASARPDVLVEQARRLRLVVLMHMPLGERSGECAVLATAGGVVTTSGWTRRWLLDRYGLRPDSVHVATPGVDQAAVAPGTSTGGDLVCVAAVIPEKGHDLLLTALGEVPELPWTLACVGALDLDPEFVTRLRKLARGLDIGDRVRFTGPLTGSRLEAEYAAADALVLASRAETYGMVVTEALARRVPVVATDVGGVAEALGRGQDGSLPGLLVPARDTGALAAALRRWLTESELRGRLRASAAERRDELPGWLTTAEQVSRVLEAVPA
jgi:glycosyltransferase involved in cell wall biosynthesis